MNKKIFTIIVSLLFTTISTLSYAQNNQRRVFVSGSVQDSNGKSLSGASVIVSGTGQDARTDADGNFTIQIASEANTLLISFIGMETKTVTVKEGERINVVLQESAIALQEVVAVGYGIQSKATLVGAVAQATEDDLKKIGSVTDLRQALSGQLPGVVSLTSSGEPGGVLTGESSTNIFIRGRNTWSGGEPLILVDGVEREMNNVDVNDVANISVLKDASATAVFGVKGANGVILITTKRGRAGKTILNFNYTSMGQMVSKLPDKLDSYEAMMSKNEMIEREGVLNQLSWNDYVPYEIVRRYRSPQTAEYAEIYPNVDWADAMFKDMSLSHRATLSVRGGSQAIQFFGSLAYLHEGDMFEKYDNNKGYNPNYNFNRLNFRNNMDAQVTKTTKLKLNISGYYSQKNTNFSNEGASNRADFWMWSSAYSLAPNLFHPRYSDGRWGAYQEGGNSSLNPLAVIYNLGVRQTRATQLNFDFNVTQDLSFITKGLTSQGFVFYDNSARSEGGVYDGANHVRPSEEATNVYYKQIYPLLYEGPDQDPSEYTVYLPTSTSEYGWTLRPWSLRDETIGTSNWVSYIPVSRRFMYQFQLNYTRQFDLHNVSALSLFKREEYARGSMFKNYREDWVFRATYDYASKYLFEANGAYNGSEQFGPGYRFDFFPSVAAGWVISEEKFFDVKWINMFKLRYSIGKVGDDQVSSNRWLYTSQYAYGGNAKLDNDIQKHSPYTFYRQTAIGNPDIRWESALKNNWGLEVGMLRNQLSLNFDYFTENRTDILLAGTSRNIPPFFGAAAPGANLGQVKSNGFEIEFKFNKSITPDLQLWAGLAITHNQNTVVFKDDPLLLPDYMKEAGFPIGQHTSLVRTGFYNNWDEVYGSVPTENNDLDKLPGYYNLLDYNGDGIIKDSEDIVPIGYPEVPQNTANLSVGFVYKRLSGHVQFYGINNVTRKVEANNFYNYTDVLFGHVGDYWSKDNQGASSFLPRWKTQAQNIGDYYVYDASSIRLRTAEIAFSLKDVAGLKKIGISDARVFINGNNLFLWSRLPDDRETNHSGAASTQGAYPMMRRVNAGINLSF